MQSIVIVAVCVSANPKGCRWRQDQKESTEFHCAGHSIVYALYNVDTSNICFILVDIERISLFILNIVLLEWIKILALHPSYKHTAILMCSHTLYFP